MFTVHLASDHAGLDHKQAIAEWLRNEGYTVVDHGAHEYDPLDDFPDFVSLAAEAVSRKPQTERAVVFGGSGQGEAMVANRFPNVRATVLYADMPDIVTLGREHNDSNVLSIGARFLTVEVAMKHVWEWLHTDASADQKYHRRNKKIETITKRLKP
jgi:ribose 5-phosphate isomerase B